MTTIICITVDISLMFCVSFTYIFSVSSYSLSFTRSFYISVRKPSFFPAQFFTIFFFSFHSLPRYNSYFFFFALSLHSQLIRFSLPTVKNSYFSGVVVKLFKGMLFFFLNHYNHSWFLFFNFRHCFVVFRLLNSYLLVDCNVVLFACIFECK